MPPKKHFSSLRGLFLNGIDINYLQPLLASWDQWSHLETLKISAQGAFVDILHTKTHPRLKCLSLKDDTFPVDTVLAILTKLELPTIAKNYPQLQELRVAGTNARQEGLPIVLERREDKRIFSFEHFTESGKATDQLWLTLRVMPWCNNQIAIKIPQRFKEPLQMITDFPQFVEYISGPSLPEGVVFSFTTIFQQYNQQQGPLASRSQDDFVIEKSFVAMIMRHCPDVLFTENEKGEHTQAEFTERAHKLFHNVMMQDDEADGRCVIDGITDRSLSSSRDTLFEKFSRKIEKLVQQRDSK